VFSCAAVVRAESTQAAAGCSSLREYALAAETVAALHDRSCLVKPTSQRRYTASALANVAALCARLFRFVFLSVRHRGAEEVGAAEVGTAPLGIAEIGVAEVGAAKVGTSEVGAAKVGTAEIGTGENGTAEVGASEVGTAEIGIDEVGSSEVGAAEVGIAEISAVEMGASFCSLEVAL
jgi:hypothetical protein